MPKQKSIQPLFGARKRLWTDGQIRKAARRIDAHNQKAEELVRAIKEGHHPRGESIGNELEAQVVVLESATEIVDDLLCPDRLDYDDALLA